MSFTTFQDYLGESDEGAHRGRCVFQSDDPAVTDAKDHFPINSLKQARNALARAAQYDEAPVWFNGTLEQLVERVKSAVKRSHPSIEVSE